MEHQRATGKGKAVKPFLLPALLMITGSLLLWADPVPGLPWLGHAVVGAAIGAAAQLAVLTITYTPIAHVLSEDHRAGGTQ